MSKFQLTIGVFSIAFVIVGDSEIYRIPEYADDAMWTAM